MKKTTFLAAASLSAALISGHLHAQDITVREDLVANQPLNVSATASSDASLAHKAAVSTISVRAIKDFKSRFTKVEEEQWFRENKGFCVYFTNDGFKVRAFYDKRGNWEASLKYCLESSLPHSVRDVVKRTYYDLAITFVNIIEVPNHIAYVVHLEDKSTLKIVRVNEEGEMDVLNDLIKLN